MILSLFLEGLATKITNGPWVCAPGPALVISTTIQSPAHTSSIYQPPSSINASTSTHPTRVPAIIGGVIGGTTILAIIVFLVWFLNRNRSGAERVVSVPRDQMGHDAVDSHLMPIPFPFIGPSPAAHSEPPHYGLQELPPPFSEVDEGRGIRTLIPRRVPPYSKRPRA